VNVELHTAVLSRFRGNGTMFCTLLCFSVLWMDVFFKISIYDKDAFNIIHSPSPELAYRMGDRENEQTFHFLDCSYKPLQQQYFQCSKCP